MIGDGEPHPGIGEVFDWFAIEFWSDEPLTITPRRTRSAVPTGDFQYPVTAEVVFIAEKNAIVIDFGLLAISVLANVQPEVCIGDFVSGEISIALPLCIEPIPDYLITRMGRQWRVDGISADLTAYSVGRRDIARISYKQVPRPLQPTPSITC